MAKSMKKQIREASRAVAERKAKAQAERQQKKEEQDRLKAENAERKRIYAEHEIQLSSVNDIAVIGPRRPVNRKKVEELAESISRIGLRTPITVRFTEEDIEIDGNILNGGHVLVTGLHRLEAHKLLGKKEIPVIERHCTEDEAKLWEISENLHRSELTPLEQAQHVEEWRRLTLAEEAKGRQVAAPLGETAKVKAGGAQPHDKGIAKTAKALGMSERSVSRAVKIASLSPEAVEVAKSTGMDKNSRALLKAAEQTNNAAEQVRILHQQAERARSREGGKSPDDLMADLKANWNAALAKTGKGADRSVVMVELLRARFRSGAMEVVDAMEVPQLRDEAKREIDALPLHADEIAEMVSEAGRVKALAICERLVQTRLR